MPTDLEVADIFRRHGDAYRRTHNGHLGRVERRVMSAIALCRTAELGGHVESCSDCGLVRCAYNSCRNRHCPKCQGQARADWLAARFPGRCWIAFERFLRPDDAECLAHLKTLGLPLVRTSPDHGTAFDIAGKGVAGAESMKAAILLAAALSKHK